MRFALDPSRPLPAELTRVATEQIAFARRALRTRKPDLHEAVHDARRAIRRTRAVLALARTPLGEAYYQTAVAPLRAAGRGLSRLRDSHSVIEALERIPPRAVFPKEARTRLVNLLIGHRERLASNATPVLRAADRWLARAAITVPLWFAPMDAASLREGLRRGCARAARAARAARDDPGDLLLHRFRQRTRVHSLQVEILRDCWPDVVDAQADEAKRLAQTMGAERDLFLLQRRLLRLRRPLSGACPTATALARLDRRRRGLRRTAFELAKLVFAERPAALARRLAAYQEAAAG
jgi:CHAD domain-containing protein